MPQSSRRILSIAICAHNPRPDVLGETLAALRAQYPLPEGWEAELLLIDNASDCPLEREIDVSWHEHGRIVREENLGLTHARFRAFREASGEIIVFVDDDNILAPDYLGTTIGAFEADPQLGAVGGKSIARYEVTPPQWFAETNIDLACRDLGDEALLASWRGLPRKERSYPICAPIGAGMGIRKVAYAAYVEQASTNPVRTALGRRGSDLASGEDNDMIMTLLEEGWRVSYLPALKLEHIIPAGRLTQQYLERYARSSSRTWVQVLAIHSIVPWKPVATWSVPLRKARAWWFLKAWRSPARRIGWQAACGQLEGRAAINGIFAP